MRSLPIFSLSRRSFLSCSVRTRLASSSGISFTEFTYQLLQAKDFLHLHLNHDCSAQIGGSDQLGNIQAGTDLVARHYFERRLEEEHAGKERKKGVDGNGEIEGKGKVLAREQVFGLTIPLLTTSSGEKFGKSVGNPVWLDEKMTSVFDFYQVSTFLFSSFARRRVRIKLESRLVRLSSLTEWILLLLKSSSFEHSIRMWRNI